MRSLESYLSEYSESHRDPRNIRLHNFCVPLITWSLIGFLHTFVISGSIHLSYIFVLGVLLYYMTFRKPGLVLSMTVVAAFMFLSFTWIPHLREVSLIIFAVAWVGQFYGHKLEGKKPSFLKDLLFLLIGPVWVLNKALPSSLKF